jgi:hypothetical protein
MKSLSTALQNLIDADTFHPIVAVTITLRDNTTVLRLANRDVTLQSNAYTGDLVDLPKIAVSSGSGIDHTVITVSNADDTYSLDELDNYYDGARCTVESYFATDATYTTFEGPVLNFSGVVSEPSLYNDRLQLTVMSDSRVTAGTIGRRITQQCLNTFRGTNCGYTHSATVATGGDYPGGTPIPIQETGLTGQQGIAMAPLQLLDVGSAFNRVKVMRGSTQIGIDSYVNATALGSSTVTLSEGFTAAGGNALQAGDTIEYRQCPRDSMENCARRWQVGDSTPQQDRFMGFDYYRDEQRVANNIDDSQGVLIRYQDAVDKIIPIAYGERWVQPLVVQSHASTITATDAWVAYNDTRTGPFAVVLISEGPVDTGIVDVLEDVMVDGEFLSLLPDYADGDTTAVSVSTGTISPVLSDLMPGWTKDQLNFPGMSGMPNVAYAIIDLPDNYDLSPVKKVVVRKGSLREQLSGIIPGSVTSRNLGLFQREYYEADKPDIRIKYKGKKVQKWIYDGNGDAIKGNIEFSRNPVWQILDLISAPQRAAADDVYSGAISETDIDHESFVDWATYADETITETDGNGATSSVARYRSDLYLTEENKESAVDVLLRTCRGSLVEKNGKIGIALDAPLGGEGITTGTTTNTLTDSNRDGLQKPTWPTGGPNGQLAGLTVEILPASAGGSGTGAGQIREIASNDANSLTVTSAWTVQPSGAKYIVYAMHLTTDNIGDVVLRRESPTHSITNEIVASFESTADDGRDATVSVRDTNEDGFGETYIDRFGKNSTTVSYPAITSYGMATRTAWYELRRGIDQNRILTIANANVEALPLEVGDLVAVSHEVGDLDRVLFRVERKVSKGESSFDITLRLFQELVYLDSPTDDFDALQIRSRLRAPHAVPPHVTNLSNPPTLLQGDGKPPTVTLSYTRPQWEFDGAFVSIEASTDGGATYNQIATSESDSAQFVVQPGRTYDVRAVFISHKKVRADAPLVIGTSTSGTSSTLTDTARNWVIDFFKDWTLLVRKGTGTEESAVVTTNTSDTMTIGTTWTNNPATDPYECYIPAPSTQFTTADSKFRPVTVLQWLGETKETPATPTSLGGSEGATQNTVDLSWTDNANDELEYHIQRAPDVTGSPGTWVTIADQEAANSNSYTDSDTTTLSTQALWWYRVRCRSIYGFSDYSNEVQVDLSLA